jgi:hypothetical protein
MKKPLFKVGQVVRINAYNDKDSRGDQRYQRITRVFPWPKHKPHPFGYKFLNGDECNEKFVGALTSKELGFAALRREGPKS